MHQLCGASVNDHVPCVFALIPQIESISCLVIIVVGLKSLDTPPLAGKVLSQRRLDFAISMTSLVGMFLKGRVL